MKRKTNIEMDWALKAVGVSSLVAVHGIVSKTVRWNTPRDVFGDVTEVLVEYQDWIFIRYRRDPEHRSLDKFLKGLEPR
jgi:hypothetical protein